jgi:CRISPR-associated protein Csm1
MKSHDHVVLGALLHDIGKFWERADRLGEYRKDDSQRQFDCPWDRGGYWSHLHVLNTRQFCEQLTEQVPFLLPESGDTTDNWINLAAHHHVASSPLERLVTAADHFASAEREQGNFYTHGIHRLTRMEALLERVNLDPNSKNQSTCYRLPLTPLSLDAVKLFPQLAAEFTPPMDQKKTPHGDIWLSPTLLNAEYGALADGFLAALAKMPIYDRETSAAKRGLVATLLAQMERFLHCVPAATNIIHADISLFDHLRVTAAIAEGLYLHHEAMGTLDQPETFTDLGTTKWRLACGDFSGIQDFIYSIASTGAARGLRGRSFYIQLLCDGVSEHLLRRLGLYPTARIYSSGGKFYLLLPDCLESRLRDEVAEVNRALLKTFQGKIFLGLGIAQVCARDFGGKSWKDTSSKAKDRIYHMGPRWQEANEALMRDRLQRFRPIAERDMRFFAPQDLHSGKPCNVCGRDDVDADIRESESGQICGQCSELQELGKALSTARYLFWVWDEDCHTAEELTRRSRSFSLPGLPCRFLLLEKAPVFSELRRLENSRLEELNAVPDPDRNLNGYACGFRFVGKWDRDKEEKSDCREFDDFANHADGIKRLGVLRMDVDNLGEIFIRGLRFSGATGAEQEMGSLSRVAMLSRQLNLFFAGHLGELLTRFERVQTIYAGGDDLFLIGSWDELPEVADTIRRRFRDYCAGNPNFTLSGGIAMVRGKYPVSRAAELAGEAEAAAKSLKRDKGRKKDALSFLDTVVGWEEFPKAGELRQRIQHIIDLAHNRAILSRLRAVILTVDEYQRRLRQSRFSTEELHELVHWQKWRWQLVYNLTRMRRRDAGPELNAELEELATAILETRTHIGRPVLDWLQLPTRWAELLTRRTQE